MSGSPKAVGHGWSSASSRVRPSRLWSIVRPAWGGRRAPMAAEYHRSRPLRLGLCQAKGLRLQMCLGHRAAVARQVLAMSACPKSGHDISSEIERR